MAKLHFYWNGYGDELGKDKFIGCQSLIKNGGKFKSDKQKKFILWQWTMKDIGEYNWVHIHLGAEKVKKYKFVEVDGYYDFGGYKNGHDGHVPAQFLYVLDENGIVEKYKGHYHLDGKGGASLVSLELVWETENEHVPFEEEVEEVKEEKKEEIESEYVGEVGIWLDEFEVTCEFSTQFENYWGWTYLNKMKDEKGNAYIWYTQSWKMEKGEKYKIIGKVKEHKEYNGEKQTILKLVKEVK